MFGKKNQLTHKVGNRYLINTFIVGLVEIEVTEISPDGRFFRATSKNTLLQNEWYPANRVIESVLKEVE
jgi:hypothetical protein